MLDNTPHTARVYRCNQKRTKEAYQFANFEQACTFSRLTLKSGRNPDVGRIEVKEVGSSDPPLVFRRSESMADDLDADPAISASDIMEMAKDHFSEKEAWSGYDVDVDWHRQVTESECENRIIRKEAGAYVRAWVWFGYEDIEG